MQVLVCSLYIAPIPCCEKDKYKIMRVASSARFLFSFSPFLYLASTFVVDKQDINQAEMPLSTPYRNSYSLQGVETVFRYNIIVTVQDDDENL